jgi:mono/diheme cytochrome c family protein
MLCSRIGLLLAVLALFVAVHGCAPSPEVLFASPAEWKVLSPELQKSAGEQLVAHSGTFREPKLLGTPANDKEWLKRGQAVYQLRCVQCHGENGDGNGPVASHMYPRPRDYRNGIFKFTSTSYGAKPLRDDLVRVVSRGIRGTSMPSFNLIMKDDLEAVVDYVLVLTHRGELASSLLYVAEVNNELTSDGVQSEAIDPLLAKWSNARASVILPMTSEPALTMERVARGKELFLSSGIGCLKCHGADGRGRTPENLAGGLKDKWGNPTRAADLTSGMLRGGQEPIDIYRRIAGRINGTPMPAFLNAFQDNPDAIWDLVAYVKFITNRRRAGESPDPGLIKPFVPIEADVADYSNGRQ